MPNLSMDLTASLPNYAVQHRIFRIFKYDQFVDFECTTFADSIKVYLISGAIVTELFRRNDDYPDGDYVIDDASIAACDNDMSRAKLISPDFNKTLTTGIRLLRPLSDGSSYTISCDYQRLYPSQLKTAILHNAPVEFTPELLMDMLQSIEELKVLTSRVVEIGDLTEDAGLLLEVDESKTNEHNLIEDEVHVVNVPNGRFLIHPKGGSFYYDSVIIKHPATNSVLTLGNDYQIVGMDMAKTKSTNYTSPVYHYIKLLTPIVGEITVTYWAFGGDPTLDNYRNLLNDIIDIQTYLNDSKTLTVSSLGSTDIMSNLYGRIDSLEGRMRRLEGTPAYGDITDGKAILMKIFAEGDDLHWFTIASLYTTIGTNVTPCTADTFTFRLQSKETHFQWKAEVSVDLSNTEGNRFNINILSENYPRGFVPFVKYDSDIDMIIRPQLRLVWVENDSLSGAYLQLGFELKGITEETISIEDMSGHESCWKLVDETAQVVLPQDNNFMMPDGISIWSSRIETAKSETMLLPFKNGHLVWAGAHSLNRPTSGWMHWEVTDLLIQNITDIKRFTKLRLDIEEINGLQFPVDIQFNSGIDHLIGHASFTHQDKPVYINAEIWKDDDEQIILRLNYDVTAGVESNELVLRDMVIYL